MDPDSRAALHLTLGELHATVERLQGEIRLHRNAKGYRGDDADRRLWTSIERSWTETAP